MRSVCLFCGSSMGRDVIYREAASRFGRFLAGQGIDLIYGGGNVGLMGAAADAALHAGGRVIGVIPQALVAMEVAHRGLTHLHVVETMHERKHMMATLAEGFVALPGGIGTLEEIFEVMTWTQLAIHNKPCGFLNVDGFFDPLFTFLGHVAAEQFLRREHLDMVAIDDDPATLLARMTRFAPPEIEKWWDKKRDEAAR